FASMRADCGLLSPMLAHPAIINETARTASASVPFVAGDCTIFSLSDIDEPDAIIFFSDS
ncbi:hypothetical protein, partial [Burkholderia stabilis]